MSNKVKLLYNCLPAIVIGLIEGLIVILALFCFLFAQGIVHSEVFFYSGISVGFISILLGLGAYYTREEELHATQAESKTIKIYQSLDIDGALKEAMIEDTKNEKMQWENTWQETDNATINLSSIHYALSICVGFIIGGIIILTNNFAFKFPDYTALAIPIFLLGILGYFKFKLTNRNPFTGICLIALSGLAAAIGAYYAGGLF